MDPISDSKTGKLTAFPGCRNDIFRSAFVMMSTSSFAKTTVTYRRSVEKLRRPRKGPLELWCKATVSYGIG